MVTHCAHRTRSCPDVWTECAEPPVCEFSGRKCETSGFAVRIIRGRFVWVYPPENRWDDRGSHGVCEVAP